MTLRVLHAPAKLNLTLEVIARPDRKVARRDIDTPGAEVNHLRRAVRLLRSSRDCHKDRRREEERAQA